MRHLLYIITLTLSFLCGTAHTITPMPTNEKASEVSQPDSENRSNDLLPNKELTLSSAQSLFCYNENSGITFCARTQPNNAQNNSVSKNPYRLIKGGKIIDLHQYPFSQTNISLSGMFPAERYLHAIRRLRI